MKDRYLWFVCWALSEVNSANVALAEFASLIFQIQAGWRGFHSRQTKLDFAEYKKIQEKNKALKKSIEVR